MGGRKLRMVRKGYERCQKYVRNGSKRFLKLLKGSESSEKFSIVLTGFKIILKRLMNFTGFEKVSTTFKRLAITPTVLVYNIIPG